MSERIGNIAVIAPEADDICEQCYKIAETRPYGIGGKRICFDCGMLDKEGTEKRMGQVLFGEP
jgi:hypothetical protein